MHFAMHFEGHFRGRDRDRAVERSATLERCDELLGLRLADALESECEMNGVEEADVAADRPRAIDHPVRRSTHGSERHFRIARDDAEKLHGARRNTGEKNLRGRQRLAGTSVLHRTVDDEVLIAGVAEDAAEDVGRARLDAVLADIARGLHAEEIARLAAQCKERSCGEHCRR